MPQLVRRPAWLAVEMSAGPGDSPALVARKGNRLGGVDAVVVPLDKGTCLAIVKDLLAAFNYLPDGHVVSFPRAADLVRGADKGDEGAA